MTGIAGTAGIAGAVLLPVAAAQAQTYNYATNTNNLFSTGFGLPTTATGSASTTLVFGGSTNYVAIDDFTNAYTLNYLRFTNSGNVTLARGGAGKANQLVFSGTNPSLLLDNTGSVNIGLDLLLSATTTVIGTGSATVSGIVSGTGGLVKSGSGTLTLTGANTYTGGTTITGGLLAYSADSNLGGASGAVQLAGGLLSYTGASTTFSANRALSVSGTGGGFDVTNAGTTLTIGNAISGTGSFTKSGLGTLTVTGNNTYTGGTTVNGGILNVGSTDGVTSSSLGNGTGTVTINSGGRSNFNASSSAGTASITNSGNLSFNNTSTAENASITNNAGATLDLSTHTGGLSVGALGGAGSVQLGGNTLTVGSLNTNTTISGSISGTGSFTKSGSGTLTLTGANTYTGGTTVNGGLLNVGSVDGVTSSSLGNGTGTVAINNGGRINFNASSSAGSASFTNNNGGYLAFYNTSTAGSATTKYVVFVTFYDSSSAGSASITTTNVGNLVFNNTSTAGNATLNYFNFGGRINFNDTSSAGNATITINSTVGYLAFNNTSTAGNATITNNSTASNLVFNNTSTAGNATLNNNSLLSFNNTSTAGNATINNNFGGLINFNDTSTADNATINNNFAGLLILSNHTGGVSVGALSGAGDVNLGSNTLTVGGLNTSTTIGGIISGAGGLTKTGTGTLTLTGTNTYTGGTTVNSGTLAVGNDTALGTGILTLGSGATLQSSAPTTINNAVTLGSAANLSSGTVTTGNVRTLGLGINGPVTLSGELNSVALTVTGASRVGITGVIGETSGSPQSLVKRGSGVLELSNDNTYTGGTLVAQGTLVVNNAYNRVATGSGTGEGAVTIARGATLTGSYVIAGPVQVNSGGTLAIGNSIGVSQVSSLNLVGGSLLEFEIGTDGITSDRLNITGLLSRSGNSTDPITFLLSGEHVADGTTAGLSEGTFTLLSFGAVSNLSAANFTATGLSSDWTSTFALTSASGSSGPGALTVTLSRNSIVAAPEPGSLWLLLLAGGTPVGLLCLRGRFSKNASGK